MCTGGRAAFAHYKRASLNCNRKDNLLTEIMNYMFSQFFFSGVLDGFMLIWLKGWWTNLEICTFLPEREREHCATLTAALYLPPSKLNSAWPPLAAEMFSSQSCCTTPKLNVLVSNGRKIQFYPKKLTLIIVSLCFLFVTQLADLKVNSKYAHWERKIAKLWFICANLKHFSVSVISLAASTTNVSKVNNSLSHLESFLHK